MSTDLQFSKNLCWLLRHGAINDGLQISSNGFVYVDELLLHRSLDNNNNRHCTVADIERIVKNDNKNRYTLLKCSDSGKLKIKANQGHSMKEVNELSLKRIADPNEIRLAVHGTYYRYWSSIRTEGLNRMRRNLIHFAERDRISKSEKGKISGFRDNFEILIYLDVKKALEDDIHIYRSENNVILTKGFNGLLSTKYFQKVFDRKRNVFLEF